MANEPSNFIRTRIDSDLAEGRVTQVVTRFPPEPNGWPHIGHAKSICLNFGIAESYGGRCHLRFDDTNPEGESEEYAEALANDIRWLGFDWGEHRFYASDYYGQLYTWAESLIERGLAYVDESSEDDIRAHRGTVTQAGRPTPFRERPAAESLDRFRRMRAGEFAEGAMVLRARIDLASSNMKMRDPLMYRIKRHTHYRTGDDWVIYPFYDYAHCLSDAIEGITHSLCTLEFENNRELYDWYIEHVDTGAKPAPKQIEFARLSLTHTVTSKRKLKQLVTDGHVAGWDDPRLPTLAGLRRRGVRPEAVRELCDRVGVARANSTVDPALFDQIIREDLDSEAPRLMAVLDPLIVIVDNWDGDIDWIDAPLWPGQDDGAQRPVPFAKRLFIERSDFQLKPETGFKRLAPGRRVRLLHGYVVQYVSHDADEAGNVVAVHVTCEPETRGGEATGKVSGSIHWVAADTSKQAVVRVYDRLFRAADPGADREFLLDLNPDSLKTVTARIEPALAFADPGSHWQFIRHGYFYADLDDSLIGAPVFNRVVSLKDSWNTPSTSIEGRKQATAPGKVGDRPEPLHPDRAAALVKAGVDEDDARVLTDDPRKEALYSGVIADHAAPASVAKFLINEVLPAAGERDIEALPAHRIATLVALIDLGTLTTKLARQILPKVLDGGDPQAIVAKQGLAVVSDETALTAHAKKAIADHPDEAQKYRDGNARMMGFFVGKVMKATGGRADGKAAKKAVLDALQD